MSAGEAGSCYMLRLRTPRGSRDGYAETTSAVKELIENRFMKGPPPPGGDQREDAILRRIDAYGA